MPRRSAVHGFTLLEMGIVLLVVSIIAGSVISIVTQNIRLAQASETKRKMDAIEQALFSYSKNNNSLPCPTDSTANAETSSAFGLQAPDPGVCTGSSPAATFNDGANVVGGLLPVKSIGLSDDYAFDGWGGKFLYAVDKRATATNAFTTYLINSTILPSPAIGALTVDDINGVALPQANGTAYAVIVSYGPNGHGAYQQGAARKSNGSTNINEKINCHCDSTATATSFNGTFVQQNNTTSATDALNSFDDSVRYYVRANFNNAANLATEAPR